MHSIVKFGLGSMITLMFLLTSASASAQSLTVDIKNVDFRGLPRVTFKACIQRDGEFVRGLGASNMTLIENGIPRALSVRCPLATEINSVVLVLDNSGSIFAAMPKLIEASKQLVDSLGPNDEAAIVIFGRDVRVVQGFTTDKALLKSVLDAMVATGGTALFDASYLACEELSFRSGNRHAVIITDGEDNLSTRTDDEVIALANLVGARLHTIAFDIAPAYRDLMERIAVQTGGAHFFVSRPGDLPAVYATIAALITEPCCIVEFYTDCVDTLHSLILTVTEGGDTARTQLNVIGPSRAEQAVLTIDVPDELTPLATDRGFILMSPIPSPGISLTMSFVLQYDQNLVDVPLLEFTLGTVTQNQIVKMERIAPGETRFTLDRIVPALNTTLLVGFQIKALVADSSRRVGFTIRDIQIEGCPCTFLAATDSTLICQCFRALAVGIDSLTAPLAADDEFVLPIKLTGGIERGLTVTADMTLLLPVGATLLEVLDGNVLEPGAIQWMQRSDTLYVMIRSALPIDTSGILLHLRFANERSKVPHVHQLKALYTELWQRCCPEDGDLPTVTIFQDGRCEFLVRRKAEAIGLTTAPNPMIPGSEGSVLLTVPQELDLSQVHVELLDMQGKSVRRLYEGAAREGEMRIGFDAASLPAGRYLVLLRWDTGVRSVPVVLLR